MPPAAILSSVMRRPCPAGRLRAMSLPQSQQQLQVHRMRKFRRAAEAAVLMIEARSSAAPAWSISRVRKFAVALPAGSPDRAMCSVSSAACSIACCAAVLPGVGHGRQHLIEAGHAHPRRRRPIRAAVKRLQVGRQKHRHRPAAAAGQQLHGVHVDLVEVGPLFAIDLDADEIARSSAARSPRFSKLSCSITWHQWQAE